MDEMLLDTLEGDSRGDERTGALMAHLLQTPRVWLTRLQGRDSSDLEIWPRWTWDQCREALAWLRSEALPWIQTLDAAALTRVCSYRNSRGQAFRNTTAEVLHHVLLHGAYHRGQIAQSIRGWGGEPPSMDLIFYWRRPVASGQ
ncbi:MAG: DinB family protein [Acidobacteriota bacterium]